MLHYHHRHTSSSALPTCSGWHPVSRRNGPTSTVRPSRPKSCHGHATEGKWLCKKMWYWLILFGLFAQKGVYISILTQFIIVPKASKKSEQNVAQGSVAQGSVAQGSVAICCHAASKFVSRGARCWTAPRQNNKMKRGKGGLLSGRLQQRQEEQEY